MRFLLASLVILLTTACGMAESRHIDNEPAQASGSAAEVGGASLAFHSTKGWANGVSLYLADAAPERLVEAMNHAIDAWNDAVGHNVITYRGRVGAARTASLYETLDDDQTVAYYEKAWTSTTGKASTTLATTIWENDPRDQESIVKGDIILNAQSYLFQDSTLAAVEDDSLNEIVDAETVLIHEIGHLLGLDHVKPQEDPDSVMHSHTFIGADMHKRELSAGDRENIQSIYGNR